MRTMPTRERTVFALGRNFLKLRSEWGIPPDQIDTGILCNLLGLLISSELAYRRSAGNRTLHRKNPANA